MSELAPNELVPVADRIGSLRWLRTAIAVAVLAGALSGATALEVPPLHLAAVTLLYAVGLITVEELSARLAGRWRGLLGLTLLLDGLYLAWAGTVTGGTRGIAALLILAHVAGVTLLVSYRTGVKVALWHSLLLYAAFELQALEVLRPAGLGDAPYPWLITYIAVLWVVAVGTASFSAVNERELRRRRVDLEALADLASELNGAGEPGAVAGILASRLRDALGFTRVAVIGGPDGSSVLATSGADRPSSRVQPAGDTSVLRRACKERRTVLVTHLSAGDDPGLSAVLPDARNVVVLPLATDDDAVEAVAAEYGTRRGARIQRRVVSAAERFTDHGALALRAARLLHEVQTLATLDGLTGTANRRMFDATLPAELSRAARTGEPVSLLMLDIDHFKAVNDVHGHQAGDDVLREVAALLITESRDFDTVARYGGEEFAVIAPGSEAPAAYAIGERLRAAVERAPLPIAVTVSVGVAVAPPDGGQPDTLIGAADTALFMAKRAGRNRVILADGKSTTNAA